MQPSVRGDSPTANHECLEVCPMTRIERVFVGELRPLPPEGQLSGIFKEPTDAPVALGPLGIAGDHQGDLRHHGGVDKALHHYPREHYALLARRWPELTQIAAAGLLGENLSSFGLTEQAVCIGDVFALGSARIQLCQPRQPCWKINHRLGLAGASQFVADQGITGWYYRVLESGTFAAGDNLVLTERPSPWLDLALYWRTSIAHRPDVELLRRIAEAPGLAGDKAERLRARAEWLRANAR